MKLNPLYPCLKSLICTLALLFGAKSYAQHQSRINAELDDTKKTLNVQQEITYVNTSEDNISVLILNDWNNAYSSKTTPLAKRFSDEFVRSFHLADEKERGHTDNLTIIDGDKLFLNWERPENHPDLVAVTLRNPLAPGMKVVLNLTYSVKLPNSRFTRYGYNDNGNYNLKNWFLTPARYENHDFIRYSNNNLDDIANAVCDFELTVNLPKNLELVSDLNNNNTTENQNFKSYNLNGKSRTDFSLFFEKESPFYSFKNSSLEVLNGLKDTKVGDIQKAIIVDRIVNFVNDYIGKYPHEKITVSQTDYDRNPFYGLNQLPSFISPFSDDFIYEIKFLKTYLNNYLKTSLRLDPRKDNWIYDGIQVYTMMKYIDENHPNSKMMGGLASLRLLKSYKLMNLGFNEQYSYFYMLMARKNLDQPLGDPKNTLIKFNEQIAGKYRAGLSFRYLDDYLQQDVVAHSISQFYELNKQQQTDRSDLEAMLKKNSPKKIDWFFETIISSRDIIDYKFESAATGNDSVTFTIRNKTGTTVPIPVYGVKKNEIVFKEWLENIQTDSTFTMPKKDAEKIVLNYQNEVPEYNLRNNWKSLKSFKISNRPVKFNFMKDLEDPYYNQILYVPSLTYNLYDGVSPGLQIHNKTILDKPFTFDLKPTYSSNKHTLIGSALLAVNQYNRDSRLYNIRYSLSGNYYHYAPDAAYLKINPLVQMRIRESNLRDNRTQLLTFRQVMVNREKTNYVVDNAEENENYTVFDARYFNVKTELTNHFNFMADVQAANKFSKLVTEIEYRKLFENNRQIDLRLFAGTFLHNKTTSDFFDFGLDRAKDYLFDYNYYGRSEETGFYSQQFIMADGGFKSKLDTPYANRWMTTLNASFTIWNWIEMYGDAGLVKNKSQDARFLYDSGIRLNLVTDYFELFFPVYSSNGWEIGDKNYGEKIRFTVTFDPKTLVKLFTRKWF